jgi:hypothetical protein
MENVRLIYEQIESAKGHLLRAGVLDYRLALILLDNVAELLMAKELQREFAFEDYFYPPSRPRRLGGAMRPKYTAAEREAARKEFEPKLRILGHHMKRISADERAILKICHRLRNEAFHVGTVRRTILAQTAVVLFQTVVSLTLKLPFRSLVLPGAQPAETDRNFLARFEIDDATRLALDEGREHMARKLLEGIAFDVHGFAQTLSGDLVRRIEENILGGLSYLNDDRNDEVDWNLQHGQFWQEEGIALAETGVRQPQLDEAFERWRAQGRAKYTVPKIERWRRHAGLIARRERAAQALEEWYAIDEKISPLEEGIGQAVADYDDRINAEIHDRRL